MKYLFLTILLLAQSSWAVDQQAYISCKESAFDALVARYQQNFSKETNTSGAKSTADKYAKDYQTSGKQACQAQYINVKPELVDEAAYEKCLDGALNSGVTRFAEYFPTSVGIAGNADALESVAEYQKDFTAADEKCRSQYLGETDTCTTQSQAAMDACGAATTSATTACDPTQDAGLKSVQAASDSVLNAKGGSTVHMSCDTVRQNTTNANQALANYQTSCTNAKKTCSDQCAQAQQAMKTCSTGNAAANAESSSGFQATSTNVDTCSMLEVKVQQAQQVVAQMTTTKNASDVCQAGTDGVAGGAAGALPGVGAAEKATASSAADASTEASSSGATAGSADTGFVRGGVGLSPISSGANAAAPASVAENSKATAFNFSPIGNPVAADSVGGKQGGSANVGGSSAGASAASENAGRSKELMDKNGNQNVDNGGFFSGGPGANRSSGTAGDERPFVAKSQAAPMSIASAMDLRHFLPGGRLDPHRSIAGTASASHIAHWNSNLFDNMHSAFINVVIPTLPPEMIQP